MSASLLLAYVSAALVIQVGVAMAVALWRRRRALASLVAAPRFAPPTLGAWDGWREFRVVRRAFEDSAHTLCSFYLQPVDGVPLPPFLPGQFLTFAVPISAERPLTRCYSLSDGPSASSYRISVKRVLAPAGRPDLAPGACSNHLHDRLQVGDVIRAKAPAGRFVVEPESSLPMVLIAGGVGITPLLSMLRAGLAATRTVHLYYGARHGAEHGFRTELEDLARLQPTLHLNLAYSQPEPADVLGRDFQHAGHVDVDLLRRTLPAGRHRFFVCGPPPMMASLIPALLAWGVLPEDIRNEAFGAASFRSAQTSSPVEVPSGAPPVEVVFRKSGRTIRWEGKDANLLDFAERQDLAIESGCRSGSCGSCEVRLISGTVRYVQKPDHEISPGHCLLCVGLPASSLELEA